jgi:hypothetical protein
MRPRSSRSICLWLTLFLPLIHSDDLTDITTSVFGNFSGVIPAAFGDFNGDKLTDMFVLKAGLRIRIHFIRNRIQHFRLNTDPDPDPIQGFNDQK